MKPGQFIQWQDLFVIVDDGTLDLEAYEPIEEAVEALVKRYPQGIACLCILPQGTKPPPDDVKRGVKDLLTRWASSLQCLTYVIEGTGFMAAAARAALVSMKIFASRPYPIFVETSLRVALNKMLPYLPTGKLVTRDVTVIMKAISDTRLGWAAAATPPGASLVGEMLPK